MPKRARTDGSPPPASPSSNDHVSGKTQAQIERKRAQDRDSQRNIRQRTKLYIAELEAKVKDLSSPLALTQLIDANEKLKSQNDELVAGLRSISQIAETLCAKVLESDTGRVKLEDLKPGHQRRACIPENNARQTSTPQMKRKASVEEMESPPEEMIRRGSESRNDVTSTIYVSPLAAIGEVSSRLTSASNTKNNNQNEEVPTVQREANFGYQWSGSNQYISSSTNMPQDFATRVGPMPPAYGGTARDDQSAQNGNQIDGQLTAGQVPSESFVIHNGINGVFASSTNLYSGSMNTYVPATDEWITGGWLNYAPGGGQLESPKAYLTQVDARNPTSNSYFPVVDAETIPLPPVCRPTNTWDAKLVSFISMRRSMTLSQLDLSAFQPSNPDVNMLLFPARQPTTTDAITHFLAGVINVWSFAIPERLGIFWLNYVFLKWQISPTIRNCQHLPRWMVPGRAQSEIPHPAYIDTIPWPPLREKLSREFTAYNFDAFSSCFCATLNVNWKHNAANTYVISPDGTATISPVFEAHLRNYDNWNLGLPFQKAFPDLARYANIIQEVVDVDSKPQFY